MKTTFKKIGNSFYVLIPARMTKEKGFKIRPDDKLNIYLTFSGDILISKKVIAS